MLLSKFSGVSPCETWDTIVAMREKFQVCIGAAEEFVHTRKGLDAKSIVIVDPITLYGLCRMGISNDLLRCFDSVAVVQTTIDLLRRQLDERKRERGSRRGHLSWDGKNYRMVELDESFAEKQIELAQLALTFAETLTLVPAEPSEGLRNQEARTIFKDIDPAFLDTIYAAQGQQRLFLCDDLIFRSLAKEALGVDSTWT